MSDLFIVYVYGNHLRTAANGSKQNKNKYQCDDPQKNPGATSGNAYKGLFFTAKNTIQDTHQTQKKEHQYNNKRCQKSFQRACRVNDFTHNDSPSNKFCGFYQSTL